ncbi:MAG: hypothetical protein Kow00107_05520 [Planctomycetota bacterium]
MAWQQTVFFTVILFAIVWLLLRYVLISRAQEKQLDEARTRPNPDEEIKVLLHELKNAMTLTDNVARLIQEKGFDEKRFKFMMEGLERFNEVVRIAGDRVGGKKVELQSVIEETLKEVEEAYPEIEIDFKPDAGEIIATEMLKYALINLFKNAAEAMADSETKKLFVHMENRSNRLFLVVKDTGCGIPAEYAEEIWKTGFTTKKDGHGVGMDVVKKGIESSDGKMLFMNSKPGHGTEFIFAFRLRGSLEGYGAQRVPDALGTS